MQDEDWRDAMRRAVEPAEEITVTQTGTEVSIDERFGRSRVLRLDGKKHKTENGTAETRAVWKEGKLVIETKDDRGMAVTETWELVPDGRGLVVMVRIRSGSGSSVVLRRIYDRPKGGAGSQELTVRAAASQRASGVAAATSGRP